MLTAKGCVTSHATDHSEQARGAARDAFLKLDRNSDGHLDVDEWHKFTADFGLTTGESVQAFKAWDLDGSNGITIDEFENVMVEVMALKLDFTEDLHEVVGKPQDLANLWAFGCCCCVCTCCISWAFLYFKMRNIKKKAEMMNKPLFERALNERTRQVKTRLLTGPEHAVYTKGAPKHAPKVQSIERNDGAAKSFSAEARRQALEKAASSGSTRAQATLAAMKAEEPADVLDPVKPASVLNPDEEKALAELEDSDPTTRKQAVKKLGVRDAVLVLHADAVVRALNDTDADVRKAALEVLSREQSVCEQNTAAILSMFNDSDYTVVREAMDTLGRYESVLTIPAHTAAVIKKVHVGGFEGEREGLNESEVRRKALDTLGKHESILNGNTDELIKALDSPDARVFSAAMDNLSKHGGPLSRILYLQPDAVFKWLDHAESSHRKETVRALGKHEYILTDKTYLAEVAAKLTDEHHDVRFEATAALGKVLHLTQVVQYVTSVAGMINDKECAVRREAIRALGLLADGEYGSGWSHLNESGLMESNVAAIAGALGDSRDEVREAAAKALAEYSERRLAPHAATLAAKLSEPRTKLDSNQCAFVAVIEALAKYEGILSLHVDAVQSKLDDPHRYVRGAAVTALGRHEAILKPRSATVRAMLEDPDADVRTQTIRAICKHMSVVEKHVSVLKAKAEADPTDSEWSRYEHKINEAAANVARV